MVIVSSFLFGEYLDQIICPSQSQSQTHMESIGRCRVVCVIIMAEYEYGK